MCGNSECSAQAQETREHLVCDKCRYLGGKILTAKLHCHKSPPRRIKHEGRNYYLFLTTTLKFVTCRNFLNIVTRALHVCH